MAANTAKNLTIVAGPNGSGKTTFVQDIYPEFVDSGSFLNADVFAKRLNPEEVSKVAIAAGKQFLHELDQRLLRDDAIIIETTLSGKTLLSRIAEAKKQGFCVRLIFLWISLKELCDFRVKGRVTLGGHNIPLQDLNRRYDRGLRNLPVYVEAVDEYEIFYADFQPKLICSKNVGESLRIFDKDLYSNLGIG